ncbi:MAG: redoxin domain-containing protein, partial [Anaerolineales bacterium]
AILGVGLLIGLAAGALIFFGLPALPRLGGGDPSVGPKATPAPIAGAPAPDFTLDDISGSAVTLSGLKGQVVLINFWATWCGPCRFEMPAIEARYAAHKDQGFTVLAVDADEPAADVSAFAQSLNLTFPVLLDPGAKVNDLYRIRGYPTTFLVDREGLIAKLHIGVMSEAQLEGYLADLGIK